MATLDSIRVSGAGLAADVAAAVIGAPVLTSTTDEVCRLSLTIRDPGWKITRTGLFAKRSAVDTGDVPLEVAVLEPGAVDAGVEGLTVGCRTRSAQLLKRTKGALIRRDISPTEWVALDAKTAGFKLVAEPSARRSQIARTAEQGQEPETAWETDRRLADELGYWLFEDGPQLFFGRPSWLLGRPGAVVWKVKWTAGPGAGAIVPMVVPELRSSDDAEDAATVTLQLPHAAADRMRPGHVIDLTGVPPGFVGRYLVTSATVPHDGHTSIEVFATTPVDPTPQEPAE